MQNRTNDKSEDRKDWVAPELKKIDLEEITASGLGLLTGHPNLDT